MPYQETRNIPAVEVPTDPFRCPKCKGQNLTLKGYVTRGFVERLQEGRPVEQTLENRLERETASIDCHACQVTFQVMTPDEHDLVVRNALLTEEITLLQHGIHLRKAAKDNDGAISSTSGRRWMH